MLTRTRWFSLGLVAGVGSSAWALVRARRLREQLTPANLGRVAALEMADRLDAAGRRLRTGSVADGTEH